MSRLIAIVLLLCGCSASPRYGNFVMGQQEAQAEMAADAADRLTLELSGGGGSVVVQHEHGDPFGRGLTDELRAAGLQVVGSADASASNAKRLYYVVDQIKGTTLLRVTLGLGGRRLSRAYEHRDGALQPAGPWSSGSGPETP